MCILFDDCIHFAKGHDEITLDDVNLRQHGGCCAIFIKYLGTWHLNGIMIPVKDMTSHWDEFVKDDPDYKVEGKRDVTGEMLLKQSGGKEILYFVLPLFYGHSSLILQNPSFVTTFFS